jgi:hypothetical protein
VLPGDAWPAPAPAPATGPGPVACSAAGIVGPGAPAPSAIPAPRGMVAVAAGPAGDGCADGDMSVSAGDIARIAARDPPTAASVSADAASARLDLVSTGATLERAECRLDGFAGVWPARTTS